MPVNSSRYTLSLFMAITLTLLISMLGCTDTKYAQYRDQKTEKLIQTFYESDQEQISINSIQGGSKINGYCVLTPYQTDLITVDNAIVPANTFLKQAKLVSQEEYWHIVIQSSSQFYLLRFAQRSFPLQTPITHMKNSCQLSSELLINKVLHLNKHQAIKVGN